LVKTTKGLIERLQVADKDEEEGPMNVGAASAVNLYTFQNTAKTSGQSAAVLQALSQVYTDSSASAGSDPMTNILTATNMAPVVNAMYALANAGASETGNAGTLPPTALQAYLSYGGMNAASAATLFASSSDTAGSSALQGFNSALTAQSTLAMAAYQSNLSFPANASAPTQMQQVLQAAQASNTTSIMNLLG
jgi:hypothetical protein